MDSTNTTGGNGEAVATSVGLAALERFLGDYGSDFLYWRIPDGAIMIETYYDKKFRALGGDTNRLISLFEDVGTMKGASRLYVDEARAANPKLSGA